MVEDKDILKYIQGNSTPQESAAMEAWLAQDPKNQLYFEDLKAIHIASQSISAYREVDIDQEWDMFQSAVATTSEAPHAEDKVIQIENKKPGGYMKYAVAASLAILVGAMLTYYNLNPSPQVVEVVETAPELTTIKTEAQKETITLPDNSIVQLSENTEIQFLSSFDEAEVREVKLLAGEANFKVAHDPQKKFKLSCKELGIEVIGTEFNVSLVGDEEISVDLKTGSVRAFQLADETNDIILNPGDKINFKNASFSKPKPIVKPKKVVVPPPVEAPKVEEVKEEVVKEVVAPPPPVEENLQSFRLKDVLEHVDKKFGKKFKLDRKLKYDEAQPVKMNINQTDLLDIISDLERLTSLNIVKGKCDDCYIVKSEDK